MSFLERFSGRISAVGKDGSIETAHVPPKGSHRQHPPSGRRPPSVDRKPAVSSPSSRSERASSTRERRAARSSRSARSSHRSRGSRRGTAGAKRKPGLSDLKKVMKSTPEIDDALTPRSEASELEAAVRPHVAADAASPTGYSSPSHSPSHSPVRSPDKESVEARRMRLRRESSAEEDSLSWADAAAVAPAPMLRASPIACSPASSVGSKPAVGMPGAMAAAHRKPRPRRGRARGKGKRAGDGAAGSGRGQAGSLASTAGVGSGVVAWREESTEAKEAARLKAVRAEERNSKLVRSEEDQLYFSKQARRTEYRAYTGAVSREYRELGKLSADLNSDELVAKRAVKQRVKDFDRNLREFNRAALARAPKSRRVVKPQVKSARQKAKEFAARVPKPRAAKPGSRDEERKRGASRKGRTRTGPLLDDERGDGPSLELLQLEHDKAKAAVDAIRAEFYGGGGGAV